MRINRRKMIGLAAAVGAGSRVIVAQVAAPGAAPVGITPGARTADEELQIARQGRLRDAQRVAMVKLPPDTEPAFRFRA